MGPGLGLGLVVGLAGCGEPPVQARAVWIDEVKQEDQSRRLHVYDRGRVEQLQLVLPPDLPLLRAQMGPRGRGLLIRSDDENATYVDLEDGRYLPLRLTPPPNNVADPVQYTASGDALFWRTPDELSVVPLTPGAPLEWSSEGDWLEPLHAHVGSTGWTVSALAAPVLFAADPIGFWSEGGNQGQGQIVALRYGETGTEALALRELGRWNRPAPSLLRRQQDCSEALLCGADWVVDPGGDTLTIDVNSFDAKCRFSRWRWGDPADDDCIAMPEALVDTSSLLGLVAALDDDILVLRDHLRLHHLDLRTGQVTSLPILGEPPYAWRLVDGGRALVWISLEGPIVRIDRSGLDIVSTVQTACMPGPQSGGLEVSPDGRWAAWGCRPSEDPSRPSFQQSAIVRASSGGIERLEGIPMVVLSIDDEGNVLMYSTENSDTADAEGVAMSGKPLSLWALSTDKVLARVHPMEPTPEPMQLLVQDQTTFIQAAALP